MITQLIIGGLASGSLYALIGIAIVLVLQATEVPNFAQGEMAMFATFVAYSLLTTYHLSWWIVLPATLAFAALQGVVVQQVVIRPLLGAPIINAVIATLGLNMALHSVAGHDLGQPDERADEPGREPAGVQAARGQRLARQRPHDRGLGRDDHPLHADPAPHPRRDRAARREPEPVGRQADGHLGQPFLRARLGDGQRWPAPSPACWSRRSCSSTST